MNFDTMTFAELKSYAKEKNIKIGNISEDKLREKLKTTFTDIDALNLDNDIMPSKDDEEFEKNVVEEKKENVDLANVIASTIDELDESVDNENKINITLSDDTVIPVKSMTYGTLIYKSRKTNAIYTWDNIGAVEPMTIGAITEMNNSKSDFLRKPYLVLMDNDAIKQFRLTKIYENLAKVADLKTLFASDIDTISKALDDALNVNLRDILISKVRTMYKNKVLKDIDIIRLLERKLQFDLSDDVQN